MGNKHGVPPVPGVDTHNPIQGGNEFKVDVLGLQSIVKAGRAEGVGYIRLAKEINEKQLNGSNVKISHTAIKKWCDKNLTEEDTVQRSTNSAINLYTNNVDMLESLNKQLDILSTYIDEINSTVKTSEDVARVTKDIKELMMTFEKLSARKQLLLNTIGEIQEKVYAWSSASEVATITLQAVKDKDLLLFAEIKEKLQENKMYMELMRKISPQKS